MERVHIMAYRLILDALRIILLSSIGLIKPTPDTANEFDRLYKEFDLYVNVYLASKP